ncbi:hypothetical protein [Paenibacillus cremeus]|uniref:PrkA C-terminal domain-containing protein n=1 Tax=Paenibacillus cremeus TaxID=2163881 RepID=A0A559KCK5_9BACL|nr:hypothetical protein FPZ49_10745 [Paenibacillus cremeus]
MDTIKWLSERELQLKDKQLQLKEQLEAVEKELAIVEVAKDYLQEFYFNNTAQELFLLYLTHIEAYCNWTKVDVDGALYDPDEKLMRRIEEKIGISENAKKAFREEVLIRMSSYKRKGKQFDYKSHERLKEAIENSL